jgi:hypothetical protein
MEFKRIAVDTSKSVFTLHPRSKRATVGDGKTVEPTNKAPRLLHGISMPHPCLGLVRRNPSGPAVMQPRRRPDT